MSLLDDFAAQPGDTEVPPRATGVRTIEARDQQPLFLKAAEGDEHGGLCDRPTQAVFKIEHDWDAVRLIPVPEDGEQNLQFEVLEGH